MKKEKLTAIGIDVEGNEIEFDCNDGVLSCYEKKLISLIIPEGVTHVYCGGNQLTELTLPEGVTSVWCFDNKITHLSLPDSLEFIRADKEVMGLEKYIGTEITVRLW